MNVLVSKCLLGCKCRYDGDDNKIKEINQIRKNNPSLNFIGICPEVEGGMEIPRKPCEIKNKKVINEDGVDKTLFFKKGAEISKKKALKNNVKVALLKAKSSSCGKDYIYDGSFSKKLIKGDGITCQALKECGIIIFNEKEIDEFSSYIIGNFS
ncbi:DUF523 domain-containing protein [Anaerococcus porci]|uniref:DUF523 domain-containing protein n=1 Tax=Anaerococcus porci TaxID=2652269 RepID=UPI002A74CD1F|nr:DUF523 domain-containing protein [Anaerococcus porci]MDY3005590.1 DUF523 domain-containing protein [Anaerococcus porci]